VKTRFVPTRAHAVADYVTGPVLAATPTALRLHGEPGSALPPRIFGSVSSAYSALTDYELAARRIIPMPIHLALDAAGGVALAAAPWLTGARRKGLRHWLPHALVGVQEIALALTTKTQPKRLRDRLPGRRALLAVVPAAAAAGAVAVWKTGLVRRLTSEADGFEAGDGHDADLASEPLAREQQDVQEPKDSVRQ
jgi:hypothetical protein